MNRHLLFVLCFATVLVAVTGWFWIQAPPSNQELLANTSKALDYAEGWKSVGGPPWWTPNFLQGHSLALSVPSIATHVWLLIWKGLAGPLTGPKIAALICLFVAALGTYGLARRLTGDSFVGAVCGVAFLLCPPVYFRMIHVEHMVFVTSFAILPFVFWTLVILLEEPNRLHGLLFGGAFSLLLIAYAKAAALAFPLVALFAAVFWLWKQRTWKLPVSAFLAALLAMVILGVLPNLPAMREMKLAAVFELAPFQGWQNAFSLKSNLLWFDRLGMLSDGADPGFAPTNSRGSNYFGLVPVVLLGAALLVRPAALYATKQGFLLRFFIALALVAHWLSFGPRPVILGQLAFLDMSFGMSDPAAVFSWFVLALQGWLIFRLLPPTLPARGWIGAALIILYLAVPGFLLISWLPVYADLRAPHDFSQFGGVLFVVLATGCAAGLLAGLPPRQASRPVFALLACVLAAIDVGPFFKPFFQSPLDRETWSDFQDATQFLARSTREGWVYPVSGRYFYLLIPYFSGRALTTEAFYSHNMLRGMKYLQAQAHASKDALRAYLRIGGVSHVFIDKHDPDTPAEYQAQFRAILPVAFENEHFVVLENRDSLAPSFLARNFISGEVEIARATQAGLEIAPKGLIVLPNAPETHSVQAGRVGSVKPDSYLLDEQFDDREKPSLIPLSLAAPREKNYHEILLAPFPQTGWAVVPEAYHPDWTASQAGRPLPVLAADGALLATPVSEPGQPVIFRFVPPLWYNGFLLVSALGWAGGGFLALAGFIPLPGLGKLKRWLHETSSLMQGPAFVADFPRGPIDRAVVVIPTYNEARSLPGMLDRVFAGSRRVDVLVVDDNSPDGTGKLVETHREFGRRLHLLARPGKQGLGSAYREGFHWAFERNFDACLEMDADLSHDPADIPRLLEALDAGADAAIGSRYLGGVRVMNWSEQRLLLSTGASRFVRLVTGMPLTDATSGFKALRCSVLKKLDWKLFRAGGYGFQVELHHALWQAGAKIVEVPIVFTERRDGETKMTVGIALEAAWRTIRLSLGRK